MIVRQMSQRCPDAELIGQASLADHVFLINRNGVATVVPEKNATVFGVLWEISADDEDSLDYYEGVSSGYYAKKKPSVQLPSGEPREALTYVATDSRPGMPRSNYLEGIIAAAVHHELPAQHVEFLRRYLNGCERR